MQRILLMVLRNIFKVPGLWFKLCHYAKNTDKYPREESYAHIQKILKLAIEAGNIDLQIHGLENIPTENGFLLYGNHQGMFDVLALVATCDMPLAAVFKKELLGVPFCQQIIDCTGSYAMDREDVRQSLTVIQNVTREVSEGRNFLIFPEGTRSKNGNVMGEFHGGSFRCATKSNVPVVPLAFIDCFKVLDEKGCKKVTVQLHYLKPIMPAEYAGMKPVELAALVKNRIQETLDRYAGE